MTCLMKRMVSVSFLVSPKKNIADLHLKGCISENSVAIQNLSMTKWRIAENWLVCVGEFCTENTVLMIIKRQAVLRTNSGFVAL